MQTLHRSPIDTLLLPVVGRRRTNRILGALALPELPELPGAGGVSRASSGAEPDPGDPWGAAPATRLEIALALAVLLFEDVLDRVPMGRAYVADLVRSGRRVVLDHGALRTVAGAFGELPAGRLACARILEPLGYRIVGTYPLDSIGMTGYAFAHADCPEDAPQYFVSELHLERFSPAFQGAAERVLGTSRDPLPPATLRELGELAARGSLPRERAARILPDLVACFDRQHSLPRLDDYTTLLAESAEMAWIATEGQAFNHATDRVPDVAAVATEQLRLGRPVKERLEVSRSGRVIQTAFRAAPVERLFETEGGELVTRVVPGSFHEFIQRGRLDDGRLDLAFDASNAQGIFAMTRGAAHGEGTA